MAKRPLPDQATLLKLLRYEPETGKLYWRERTPDMFSGRGRGGAVGMCARFNSQWAGKPALTAKTGSNHCSGLIQQESHLAHRVIWKMMTGEEPGEVWHRNGIGTDNRFQNLIAHRPGQARRPDRPIGIRKGRHPGVWWNGECERWVAMLGTDFLGTFADRADAIEARVAAERKARLQETISNSAPLIRETEPLPRESG